jgi:hypothetical protein
LRLYVSGSIQFEPNHREIFAKACRDLSLISTVTEIVNPLEVEACPTEDCGGTIEEVKGYRHTWSCYMKYDIQAMLTCDGIYMIRGWHTSPGARLEQFVAASCGLNIYFDLGEVR